MYSYWEMVRARLTDGWQKWHIEVGTPPKNKNLIKVLKTVIKQ